MVVGARVVVVGATVVGDDSVTTVSLCVALINVDCVHPVVVAAIENVCAAVKVAVVGLPPGVADDVAFIVQTLGPDWVMVSIVATPDASKSTPIAVESVLQSISTSAVIRKARSDELLVAAKASNVIAGPTANL